jgi:hypothetical protein
LTDAKTFSPATDTVNVDDVLKLETGMMGSSQILKYKAFVTTPEPHQLVLGAIGLLSLVGIHWRRQKRTSAK